MLKLFKCSNVEFEMRTIGICDYVLNVVQTHFPEAKWYIPLSLFFCSVVLSFFHFVYPISNSLFIVHFMHFLLHFLSFHFYFELVFFSSLLVRLTHTKKKKEKVLMRTRKKKTCREKVRVRRLWQYF